jgi:hypothetical protein
MTEEANDRWKTLMNIWLEGALHASTFILATQVKLFTRAMSNVVTDLFMQTVREQYGVGMDGAETMAQAIEHYMAAEVQAGLAADGDLSVREKDAYTVEVTVADCPYGVACGNFVSALQQTGEFGKDDIPCLRANCYGAAVARMTGDECSYRLLQSSPGIRCRARLEAV